MNPILSKILQQLINPLSLCIWLIIFSGLITLWRKKLGVTLLLLTVALLWLSSTSAFSSYLVSSLEKKHLPIPVSQSPTADVIVILGGAVGAAVKPRLELDLTGSSDRVLHAAWLYRAGKAPLVIVSGGGIRKVGKIGSEANTMSLLLQEWGVPAKAIILETESLNTYQNAVNTKRIINEKGLNKVLLVTSSIHMPRALATFQTMGIETIPSPTDYNVVDQERFNILSFFPDPESLVGTTDAVKEYLGLMVYRLRGWVE